MKTRNMWVIAVLLCVPVVWGVAATTTPQATDATAAPAAAEQAQNSGPATLARPAAPSDDKNVKRFGDPAEVTKDMGTMEGLFTLYRFDPGDTKRDPERLLAKIPKSLLGEDLLFAMSISRGEMAGWMWGDQLVRWQVAGDQLKLVAPDMRFAKPAGQPVTEAVERTYTDGYVAAVPIAAMTPQGDVIIDLGPLLKSDIAEVSSFGGRVRPELSTWSKVKVFPDNILIDANLSLAMGTGGKTMGVSYAFRRLPKLGTYKPRLADPRIGYFLTVQQDWSKKTSERETFNRYINRWKLEKQDPSLELSPPKEPIVFIIEKTVPLQWRRWVRDGIAEWNRAFEKIGFLDAVVVQQQTDSNEYADYDPEDARYNFLRWGVSGDAFAVGPSRADPRTGQILDADILFDDAFVRAWMYRFDVFGPNQMAAFAGPGFEQWLAAYPQFVPGFLRDQLAEQQNDPEYIQRQAVLHALEEHGHCACSYAGGVQQQLALGQFMALATGSGGKKLPERVIGEAIQEIVTHEVGHTLGLRHNFKASSWLSLDEIKRRRDETDLPTVASVMDYSPLLFFAGDNLEKLRHCVTPVVGPYDDWAIAYGYMVPEGKEEDALKELANRSTEPELQYASDQDTNWMYSPDPLVNRYDLSSNPIDYANSRIALTDELIKTITTWGIQAGEPRYYLTRVFNVLWSERSRNMDYVARVVGGQYFHQDHQGAPNARPAFELLPPEQQRAALRYLGETLFNDAFFKVDPALLNLLAPSRWGHWGSPAPARIDYPIHDQIRGMQATSLLTVMAPPVLQRVYDAELKSTAPDKFTAAELITSVRDTVWKPLSNVGAGPYSDAQPCLSSVQRNLQRLHLEILLDGVQAPAGNAMSPDIQAMLRLAASELSEKIGTALAAKGLDFGSRAHLSECKSRIDRVLAAQFKAE